MNAAVSFKFEVVKKQVVGIGEFRVGEGESAKAIAFRFKGGYLKDEFLRVEFNPEDETRAGFGAMVLQLCDDGKLIGTYVGYGYSTHKMVRGTLRLRRNG